MKAIVVARFIEEYLRDKQEKNVTHNKLHMLLFYCQAVHLGAFQERLFEDDIYVWKNGLITESVYTELNKKGNEKLHKICVKATEDDYEKQKFIHTVLDMYGFMSSYVLKKRIDIDAKYLTCVKRKLEDDSIKQRFSRFASLF